MKQTRQDGHLETRNHAIEPCFLPTKRRRARSVELVGLPPNLSTIMDPAASKDNI